MSSSSVLFVLLALAPQLLPSASDPAPAAKPVRPVLKTVVRIPDARPSAVPGQTQTRPKALDLSKPKISDAARAAVTKAQSVKDCQASQGRMVFTIKGLRLHADGSDVDEIYGRIWVDTSRHQVGAVSNSHRTQDWPDLMTLWASKASVDLGKLPTTDLSTIQFTTDGARTDEREAVYIHFDLRDEDGGRGGSDDEFFYLGDNQYANGAKNIEVIPLSIPSCDSEPAFVRQARRQIIGHPSGSAYSNSVTLDVSVEARRE